MWFGLVQMTAASLIGTLLCSQIAASNVKCRLDRSQPLPRQASRISQIRRSTWALIPLRSRLWQRGAAVQTEVVEAPTRGKGTDEGPPKGVQQDYAGKAQHSLQPAKSKGPLTASPTAEERDSREEQGLSQRQKRRRRVGWALRRKRAGRTVRKGERNEKQGPVSARFTRDLETQLCHQIQEAQRLRQVYHEAADHQNRQFSESEWAQAAGLGSPQRLAVALREGAAAEKRLLREHQGFLVSLVRKFARRGVDQDELFFEAQSTFISMAERFDASKKARLTTYAWAQIVSNLQRLCESEGALLPMSASANRDTVKLERAENELSQQTGNSPSLAEIAARAGLPQRRVQLLRERQRTTNYESIISTGKDGIQRGPDELVGTGVDEAASQAPDATISEREQALHVRAIVSLALEALASAKGRSGMQSQTNQRIVQAMRLRYGLDDNRPRTYVEIAEEMEGCSRMRAFNLVEEGKERLADILEEEDLLREIQNCV